MNDEGEYGRPPSPFRHRWQVSAAQDAEQKAPFLGPDIAYERAAGIYPVQFYDESDRPVPAERPVYGIALSFPSAGLSADDGIVYRVNNIYWSQEFELQ